MDKLYRAYLLGHICDREFSERVDELIRLGQGENALNNSGKFAGSF